MARRLDIAWAGGLFEGEGSASIVSGSRQPSLQLVTTDEDVIVRFAEIVGRGTVRYYERQENKDIWQWSVQSKADVLHVANLLTPYLGQRRTMQMAKVRRRALELLPASERTHCKRGHPLSGSNLYLWGGKRGCRTCRNGWAVVPSG